MPAKTEMPWYRSHHGVDQFHHQDGLADTGAAEHRRLAALRQRHQQVDHLDAGLEHRGRRGLLRQFGRRAMDRPARRIRGQWRLRHRGVSPITSSSRPKHQ